MNRHVSYHCLCFRLLGHEFYAAPPAWSWCVQPCAYVPVCLQGFDSGGQLAVVRPNTLYLQPSLGGVSMTDSVKSCAAQCGQASKCDVFAYCGGNDG